MGKAIGIALLALLVSPAAARSQAQSPEELIARAVKLHHSGDLETAISAYRAYLEARPDDVQARSNLGAAYVQLGRHAEAIEQYKAALDLDKYNPTIRFNLALAYYKTAQIPEAALELAKVAAAQPDNRNAVLLLADCHLRRGEEKKVIELLSPLQKKHQDDRALLYLLGTALIRDNQIAKGQPLVDRILRDGDSAEARLMLGTAKMMGHDFRGAIAEFAQAVKLNPKLPSAHSFYGRALLATGDRDRAMDAFRRELEINPNDFDSNLYLGVTLKQEQKLEEGLSHFQRALQVRPGAPSVRYQIATVQLAEGKLPEAQRILEELVREWPDFVEAHVSLATVYYRLKRKEDGDRHAEIVRKLNAAKQARAPGAMDQPAGQAYRGETIPAKPSVAESAPSPESFDALAGRATGAREADRADEAIAVYQQALEKKPSWAEGWWYLGTLFYEKDRYGEARDAFAKLAELKPTGGAAWSMLGLCEHQLGQYLPALEHLLKGRSMGLPGDTRLSFVSRYHLAILLNRFGKHEAALRFLYALARKKDESPAVIDALGLSAMRLQYLPAEVPQEKLGLIHKAGRAQYYMAIRQMEEARKASKELIAEYPRAPNVHYSFGVFLLLENADAALEEFRREIEISPSHVPARLQIAFEYIKRNDFKAGLPYAEEAVKLDPESFVARNALGRILLGLGQVDPAVKELEAGLKLAPDSPEMHFALARAYARAGRKEDAARARAEFQRLDKIRRTSLEGSQAVGGIQPPPETGRPPG